MLPPLAALSNLLPADYDDYCIKLAAALLFIHMLEMTFVFKHLAKYHGTMWPYHRFGLATQEHAHDNSAIKAAT